MMAPSGHAVLAPQSGGCARHALSQRVTYRIDERGDVWVDVDAEAPSFALLLQSTLTLMVDASGGDGEIHITGRLLPSAQGGSNSAFRLDVIRAHRVSASGEKQPVMFPLQ